MQLLLKRIVEQGQLIFGIAIAALGGENLVCAHLAPPLGPASASATVIPVIPWVPGLPWLGYVTGAVLLLAGLSVLAGVKPRVGAMTVGVLFLGCDLGLHLARAIAAPASVSVRTLMFEPLALGSAALVLAGTMPRERGEAREGSATGRWDDALRSSGLILFAISAVVFGVDHFLVLDLIASLVPSWMPWHMFWAYFTGAAFIVAGLSIGTKWMGRWGATALGAMFLLWFLLLHAPRVLGLSAVTAAPRDPNEWSSALIALAMCGASWICACALRPGAMRGRANERV